MIPSQHFELAVTSTGINRQPTIASRRQRSHSKKLLSNLSINTSASYQDFATNKVHHQRNVGISKALSNNSTTQQQQSSQYTCEQSTATALTNIQTASISDKELSSRIADSFQQFSNMLNKLSSDNASKGIDGSNITSNATTGRMALFNSTTNTATVPVTPSHSVQDNVPERAIKQIAYPYTTTAKLPKDHESTGGRAEPNHQSRSAAPEKHRHVEIKQSRRQEKESNTDANTVNKQKNKEKNKMEKLQIYAAYDHKMLNAKVKNEKVRLKLVARWFNRAAAFGDLQTMEHMLQHVEVDVNRTDDKESGITPLMYAAYFGQTACMKLLLNQSTIQVDKQDRKGWTALTWASISDKKACIDLLLSCGADTSTRSKIDARIFVNAAIPENYVYEVTLRSPTTPLPIDQDAESASIRKSELQSQIRFSDTHSNDHAILALRSKHRLTVPCSHQLLDTDGKMQRHSQMTDVSQLERSPKEEEVLLKEWMEQLLSSCAFDWHKCLYDQMLVFEENDIPVLIELALQVSDVKALKNQSSLSNDLWCPANVMYLCSRYAHHYSSKELLLTLFEAFFVKQSKVIKAAVRDKEGLAFAIANMCQLSAYLKKDLALSVSTRKLQEKLAGLIWTAYTSFVSEASKEIEKVLDACMLDYESFPEIGKVEFADDWQRFFKRSSSYSRGYSSEASPRSSADGICSPGIVNNTVTIESPKMAAASGGFEQHIVTSFSASKPHNIYNTPRNIAKLILTTQAVLQSYHAPEFIAVQCLSQLIHYVAYEMLQRINSPKKRKYLCRSKALQICLNLSSLEEWLSSHRFPSVVINKYFQPLKQQLQLLQCLSQIDDVFAFTLATERFDKLSPKQIALSVQNYRYEVAEARLPTEVEQLAMRLAVEYEQEQNQKAAESTGENPALPTLLDMNAEQLDLLIERTTVKSDRPGLYVELENAKINKRSVKEQRNSHDYLPFSITATTDLLYSWRKEQRKSLRKSLRIEDYADSIYNAIKLEKQENVNYLDKIYPSLPESFIYRLDKRTSVR